MTIGVGSKGAEISSVLHRKGIKVNRIPLFRCYAVLNRFEDVRDIKLSEENKFFLPKTLDVTGILNEIMSRYEIHEGAIVITSFKDEDVKIAVEISRKLKDVFEDPVMVLGIINTRELGNVIGKIKLLKDVSDFLILTRDEKIDETVEALNILARVGEIDLKKKVTGEVVVDTSDLFNALSRDGFTIIGQARRRISLFRFLMKRSHLLALRTQRMLDLVREAIENLSFEGDIETAKSALIVFAGNPDEMTMDGLFASIDFVENLNRDIVVRYGDYPIPNARFLSVAVLFSGLRRIKFD